VWAGRMFMTKHKQGIPGRGRLLFRDVTAVQNDPLLCIYIYIYIYIYAIHVPVHL